MQPVNTFNIPFAARIPVDRKVCIADDVLPRKIVEIWHRTREAHFAGSVTQRAGAVLETIAEKVGRTGRSSMEDDIWLDILRADLAIPARGM